MKINIYPTHDGYAVQKDDGNLVVAYVATHYEALSLRDEWLDQQPTYDNGLDYEVVDVDDVRVPVLGYD